MKSTFWRPPARPCARRQPRCPRMCFLMDAVTNLGLHGMEVPIIKGDATSYAIAAASIVAKVTTGPADGGPGSPLSPVRLCHDTRGTARRSIWRPCGNMVPLPEHRRSFSEKAPAQCHESRTPWAARGEAEWRKPTCSALRECARSPGATAAGTGSWTWSWRTANEVVFVEVKASAPRRRRGRHVPCDPGQAKANHPCGVRVFAGKGMDGASRAF